MHVLIAEDTKVAAILLRNILERAGHTVSVAEDGIEALELLEQHPEVGLLAVDVHMPRMGGIELVTEVRKRSSMAETPVIFITGEAQAATVRKAVALRPAGYILKPILEPSRVLERVQAAIRSAPSILEDEDETCRRLGIAPRTHSGMLEALAVQLIEARPGFEIGEHEAEVTEALMESSGQLGAARLASKLAEASENRDVSGVLHEIDAVLGELSLRGIRPAQEWKKQSPTPSPESPSEATNSTASDT